MPKFVTVGSIKMSSSGKSGRSSGSSDYHPGDEMYSSQYDSRHPGGIVVNDAGIGVVFISDDEIDALLDLSDEEIDELLSRPYDDQFEIYFINRDVTVHSLEIFQYLRNRLHK